MLVFYSLAAQGNKKLDKAEILEMSIEYLQRMHNQTYGKSGGECN